MSRAALAGGGGSGRSGGRLGTARAEAGTSAGRDAAHAADSAANEFDVVLDLQEAAGNQAVVQLLVSGAVAGVPPPRGFPAAGNRALGAVLSRQAAPAHPVAVQREMAVDTDPKLRVDMLRDAIRFEPLFYRFVIDADKTTEALSNMTAEDGRRVKAQFKSLKGWNLGWVFSAVEQPISDGPAATNNLSYADRTKMLNLLGGTAIKPAAPPPAAPTPAPAPGPSPAPAPSDGGTVPAAPVPAPPRPEAAAARVGKNRLRVVAASIRSAVQKKDVKAAIALIPASMEERREIDRIYDAMYGQTAYMALFTKLPGKHGQRAAALWYDEKDDADRLAIEAATDERDKAEAEAKTLEKSGMGIFGEVAKKRRQEGKEKVEAEVKRVASAGDQSTLAGRAASRERLKKVLDTGGPKGKLAKRVGADSDPIIRAIQQGDEADVVGARLARADATTDVTAAQVEAAIREVRSLAEDQADLTIDLAPDALEAVRPYLTKAIIDGYFGRFKEAFDKSQTRRTFNAMLAGRGGTDERAAKALGFEIGDLRDAAGQTADINRNKVLMARGGDLEEWGELFFALTKKPKDIERVRQILGSKTYTQVRALSEVYANRSGRSLETDLAGTELEQKMATLFTGEAREELGEKRALLSGGVWDREIAEKTVPRDADAPTREAHLLAAEGDFLFKRLAALERRVLENRGLFAKARDWSGNEEKSILDKVRADMWAAKGELGKALNPDRGTTWKEGEEGTPLTADLGAAQRAVAELRRLDRRLSHAVTIYKESTKKAYEEFVDLVVNAATIAAGLGVTGIWITAIRTTAATVGTKLLMKGSDYSVDEFFADIQGGMAGVAGDLAKLGMNKLVTPYVAGKIMRLARRVGMSKEMYAQVQARIGPLALRQAEHTIGTGVSNVAQGRDVTEGQGLGERIKGEVIGAVTAPIDEKLKARKAGAARARAAAAEPEQYGPVRRSEAGEGGGEVAPGGAGRTETGDDTDAAAGAVDEAPAPAVPMALPEPAASPAPIVPRVRGKAPRSTAGSVPKPAPPTEPAPAPTAGAKPGRQQMDRPRPDADGEKPAAVGKPTAEPGRLEDAAPQAISGKGPGGESKGMDYPAGTQQLNVPATGGADPAVRPAPSAEELKPRPRSEALQRKALARIAEAGRFMALTRDNPPGSEIRTVFEAELRAAQDLFALAHGQRAPTADELHRLNTEEALADAEADYADVRGMAGSPKRVAAEEAHVAARQAHARAREALDRAHANVRQAQRDAEPGSPLRNAAEADFDKANADFRNAQADVKRTKAELSKAKAGLAPTDWRRRRAEIALHGARRERALAHGEAPPPDTLGPMRKGDSEEVQGPPEFEPALWDRELVIQLKDKHSFAEHQELFFKMLDQDPTREVGFFRNSVTGEIIIVRGKEGVVSVESGSDETGVPGERGPAGAGEVQRWKQLLDTGSDVGGWVLVAHSHPSKPGGPIDPLNQYPSGYKGDFSVIVNDAKRDMLAKTSTIYYMDNGVRKETTFGFDPYNTAEPFWIQLPGEPPVRFKSLDAYQEHVRAKMKPHKINPDFKPVPPDFPRGV